MGTIDPDMGEPDPPIPTPEALSAGSPMTVLEQRQRLHERGRDAESLAAAILAVHESPASSSSSGRTDEAWGRALWRQQRWSHPVALEGE
jgi:hypothetical protein